MSDESKRVLCVFWDAASIVITYGLLILIFHFLEGYPLGINTPVLAVKNILNSDRILYTTAIALGVMLIGIVANPLRTLSANYGGAHWATEKEIKALGLRHDTGLILGIKNGEFIRTNEPLSVLLFAPPGSGKTAAIVIPCLLSCGNSMIVHDPKGELLEKTGPRRSEFSKIIQFAPGERISARWNPLSKKELPEEWEDIQVHVDRVANSIIAGDSKSGDDMWTREGRSIFTFWCLYLIYKNGETSMPEILDMAFSSSMPQELIGEVIEAEGDKMPQRLKVEGNGLLAKAEKEFAGVIGTFKSKMSVFNDSRVKRNVSTSDFCLADLRNEVTTVYLTVRNNDQTRLKQILSLFFEVATSTYLDHEPSKDEITVTLMLDEFVRLAKMEEVLKMPAIGRSYRLQGVYVAQSFSQLIGIYGKEGADELKNTCNFHIYFSQNEADIARGISEAIGKFTRKKRSYSSSPNAILKSESESEEGVPLILPQEIMSLPFGKMLICRQFAFETPVNAIAAMWYKDKGMCALVPNNPDRADFIDIPKDAIGEVRTQELDVERIEPVTNIDDLEKDFVEEIETEHKEEIAEAAELEFENEIIKDQEVSGEDFIEISAPEIKKAEEVEEAEKEIKQEEKAEDKYLSACSACGRKSQWKEQIGEECLEPNIETAELCEGIMEEIIKTKEKQPMEMEA